MEIKSTQLDDLDCCQHCGSRLRQSVNLHSMTSVTSPLSQKAYSFQAQASRGDCEIEDPATDEDEPEAPSPLSPVPEPMPIVHSTQPTQVGPRRSVGNRWKQPAGQKLPSAVTVSLFGSPRRPLSQHFPKRSMLVRPQVATNNLVDELKRAKHSRLSGHRSVHSATSQFFPGELSEDSALHVSLDLTSRCS